MIPTAPKLFALFLFLLNLVACQTGQNDLQDQELERLSQKIEQNQKLIKQTIATTIRNEILPELREVQLGNSRLLTKKQIKLQKNKQKKIIIGRVEWINLVSPDLNLRARIDTGAQTCSLHAESIVEKEINGEKHVEFTTLDEKNKPVRMLHKVVEMSRVKSTSGKSEKRYVIELDIIFGKRNITVNVNLNDRKKLRHRFLVGRNLLLGDYIVDVSQSRVLGDAP
jgi:hypothetical protein